MEPEAPIKKSSFIKEHWKGMVVVLVCLGLVAGAVALYPTMSKIQRDDASNVGKKKSRPTASTTPIDYNDTGKFGFLINTGDPETTYSAIQSTGAKWLRPHPGGFIWNEMQRQVCIETGCAESPTIDFDKTDEAVKAAQKYGFHLLVTLWPYAQWDQSKRSDVAQCSVSNKDQFSREIPPERCNPNDWLAYENWLRKTVERYDGDGKDDMMGLKQPVRYWEIINEPEMKTDELTFYKGNETEYAELLTKSSKLIKETDKNAKIVIAGAAGDDEKFLKFWDLVFTVKGVAEAFDIGNIHAISGGNGGDFNVTTYKNLLAKHNIVKPIWVTEAEGKNDKGSIQANADDLGALVKKALESGAIKIFFTHASFSNENDKYNPIKLIEQKEYYKTIIGSN